MHLTGGLFKGRIILNPKGENGEVRPTLSKVRESVFNILSSHFSAQSDSEALSDVFLNFSFLDMFAGSGIMALEAYSRGFKNVTAIEYNTKIYSLVKKTFENFKVSEDIKLIKGDSLKILSKLEGFDVIYIDPPWAFNYAPIIQAAFEKLNKNGIIIVEYDKKMLNLQDAPTPFKQKIYGRTGVNFYKK